MMEVAEKNGKKVTKKVCLPFRLLLEGDAVVEGLDAFLALRQEVEADATDVLLGTERLGVIDLVALNLEFHHTPVWETNAVAIAQVAVDNLGQ